VNKTTTTSQGINRAWKNLCWMVLLGILFQSVFISSAEALSLQTSSIYTVCNHLNGQHDHDGSSCKQHCASAIDHYTQNFLLDAHGIQADHITTVLAYFNSQPSTLNVQRSAQSPSFLTPISPHHKNLHVYLKTARLRI